MIFLIIEAINWHVIWKMSGSPPEGYVFEMRKASRAKYHKQIKFIHNHREEIRAKNIATSFLNKDFNAYYHSVNLLKVKVRILALLLMVTLPIKILLIVLLNRIKLYLMMSVMTKQPCQNC